jgi:hypothetical protein
VKKVITQLGSLGLVLYIFSSFIGCSGDTQVSDTTQADPILEILKTAQIFPESATTNSRLEVKFKTGPGVNLPALSYEWKRNGGHIREVTGSSLDTEYFRKGDEISVRINGVTSDGSQGSYEPPSVVIRNTPPKVIRASTFFETHSTPVLLINAESTDADEDLVSFSYRWYRNGELIPDESNATLDPSLCRRGDHVHAAIIANDGESSAPPFESEVLELPNHAPRILSTPPSTVSEGRRYVYKIQVDDPDGDTISYELVSGPPGMSIERKGTIEWIIPAGNGHLGEHTISVKVNDGLGGEATQDFVISIQKREKVN